MDSVDKLDMIGVPNSGGIYAPCLTYADKTFYFVYTNVRNGEGRFWDCKNYLVTAAYIYDPWSEPIYLNGSGIDPSLFHDEDRRKWLVNAVLSHKEGWLRLYNDSHVPPLEVEGPNLAEYPWYDTIISRDDFDKDQLDIHFQTLRIPLTKEMMSLTERKGYLRLKGQESPSSKHAQSLVARRQQDFCYKAITAVDFLPDSFQQMAGLICYYDTTNYIYLYISCDEEKNRVINLMINDLNQFTYVLQQDILLPAKGEIYLKVEVNYDMARFFYSVDNMNWNLVGGYVEYSKLSDEYFKERKIERFTGAFVGMCCQDFTGSHIPADFDFFVYEKG